MLIFPSYYRRERPELVGHPAALVSYRFNERFDVMSVRRWREKALANPGNKS